MRCEEGGVVVLGLLLDTLHWLLPRGGRQGGCPRTFGVQRRRSLFFALDRHYGSDRQTEYTVQNSDE